MKILIYENPFVHGNKVMFELMKHLKGLEVEIAESLEEAEETLSNKDVDYTIVHHSLLREIDSLKEINKHSKYIGYSGQFQEGWFRGDPTANRILSTYDRIIHSPKDILEIIKDLELERLGK